MRYKLKSDFDLRLFTGLHGWMQRRHLFCKLLTFLYIWLQVSGCSAAHRPRPPWASQWPGVDREHKDDAARAAEREDLGGLLPPRAAVCLLPSTHHPVHLCQHPHLLVGNFIMRWLYFCSQKMSSFILYSIVIRRHNF